MSQKVNVNGVIHNFPDNATPQMISKALGVAPPTNYKAPTSPSNYPFGFNVGMGLLSRLLPKNEQETATSVPFALQQRQPSTAESFGVETGKQLPEMAATAAIPPLRLSKYLPQGYNIAKGLLNYGTDIGQNALMMGGMNALEGNDPIEGAGIGAIGTAVINPLIQTFASKNPYLRMLGAGALGGLATMGIQSGLGTHSTAADLLGGSIGAGLGFRGRNARDLAMMNLLKDVDLKRAMPRIRAVERLGLEYIRPSEATASGYIGGIEGSAGHTPEAALLLEQKTESRQKTEKAAIDKLYDLTFKDKEMTPQVDRLYKASYQSDVTPQFLNNLTKSATIRKAMQEIDENPIYQDALKGVKPTSFAYLDQVKRKLDDMASAAEPEEARIINQAKNNLVKRMDTLNPSYREARRLAQRKITRDKMIDAINEEEVKGTTFFQKNLRNDDKFDEIMRGLKQVPQAQRQANDMRLVFRELVDSGKQTARAGAKLSQTSMSDFRSSYQAFIHKLQGGDYDKAMVELMTDPKWYKYVDKAKKMAEPNEKARIIANAISRITGKKFTDIYGNNK